jgi:hypothetical protein
MGVLRCGYKATCVQQKQPCHPQRSAATETALAALHQTALRMGRCLHTRKHTMLQTGTRAANHAHAWLVKGKGGLTAAHENLVRAVLVAQLGGIALARLKLDGDLLLVEQVGALEDDAEAALANLLPDAVVDAHHVGGRCAAAGHVGCKLPCRGAGDRRRDRGKTATDGSCLSVCGGCAAEQQAAGGGGASDGAAAAAKEALRRGEEWRWEERVCVYRREREDQLEVGTGMDEGAWTLASTARARVDRTCTPVFLRPHSKSTCASNNESSHSFPSIVCLRLGLVFFFFLYILFYFASSLSVRPPARQQPARHRREPNTHA